MRARETKMSETCSICGGAMPDGAEREAHTSLCAAVISEEAKRLLTDVDDLMGTLRLVASMEYDRAEVRTLAHLALERLKVRGV
jgi:hypothetical protein